MAIAAISFPLRDLVGATGCAACFCPLCPACVVISGRSNTMRLVWVLGVGGELVVALECSRSSAIST